MTSTAMNSSSEDKMMIIEMHAMVKKSIMMGSSGPAIEEIHGSIDPE